MIIYLYIFSVLLKNGSYDFSKILHEFKGS